MAFRTSRPYLWLLIIQSLFSTSVTSIAINLNLNAPKTFWVDGSCMAKGFTPTAVQESLDIAGHGSRRLLNLHDNYQAWVYNLLFKSPRYFSVMDDTDTEAWNVVEVEGWISTMKYETSRDTADVRIYCDDDDRWRPVPDDPVQIARGMMANSARTPRFDQEFEDPINFMRRDTGNQGCKGYLVLGVTYDSMYPPGMGGVPENYHSPRQTITLCNLAFRSPVMRFAQIAFQEWRFLRMGYLNLVTTNVLLYQLLNLAPYYIRRDPDATMGTQDTWARMLGQTEDQLSGRPAPYTWNAVLAYAASKGWGIPQDLTQAQYVAGQALFRYTSALINVPFIRGGPITLPNWMLLPAFIDALGTA